ncbi:hypothetical protein ATJ97_0727 [Georgenia soli]|uniref:Uncharacterized protein n=2 Tax=Georgenia soli TaxID=638953 RepID=A0A2A9EH60_9MICO|nr:hypothetical protein ATJ97_0727 [Georgenia soli]
MLLMSSTLSPDPFAWFGAVTVVLLVVPAVLGLLIQYWIIRMGVKHGILAADRQRARSAWASNGWDRERL